MEILGSRSFDSQRPLIGVSGRSTAIATIGRMDNLEPVLSANRLLPMGPRLATWWSRHDRWHVLPDMTMIYERRPGEFEDARVLTASTLRDRPLWIEDPKPAA